MAQDKAQELLSYLLIIQKVLEGDVKHKFNLERLNKAISIVEDSIRYRRAFFTIEE